MLITKKVVSNWVILSVRLGDLITLLIIAKGGQCKDVYVPENIMLSLHFAVTTDFWTLGAPPNTELDRQGAVRSPSAA